MVDQDLLLETSAAHATRSALVNLGFSVGDVNINIVHDQKNTMVGFTSSQPISTTKTMEVTFQILQKEKEPISFMIRQTKLPEMSLIEFIELLQRNVAFTVCMPPWAGQILSEYVEALGFYSNNLMTPTDHLWMMTFCRIVRQAEKEKKDLPFVAAEVLGNFRANMVKYARQFQAFGKKNGTR